jgi:hypothetical protein
VASGLNGGDSGAPLVAGAVPRSLPALGWALRSLRTQVAGVETALESLRRPVQVYRVHAGPTVEAEAESAAHAVRHAVERLRRLAAAYGEWSEFDPAAYFDLTAPQAGLIVQTNERVTAVHITFFADLLLPSFQRALATWATIFVPGWQRRAESGEAHEVLFEQAQPLLVDHVQRARAVVERTRRHLLGEIGYLAANGASEERWRWTLAADPPPGLAPALLLEPHTVPTLTLTSDFPLPLARQPERQRRLRRHRARRTWSDQRHARRGPTA